MINHEWFPTPPGVCRKMYAQIGDRLTHRSRVLDPSAGNGAILDYIKDRNKDGSHYNLLDARCLYALEIEMEFRYILCEKGYRVLGADFLAYSEPQLFDVVVMNPPFSGGAKHVIHAWEFVKPGGQLIAILNAESIRNPCTKERELLASIIAAHGKSEDLGQCFKDAERSTDVEVAMIVLSKPEKVAGDFVGFSNDRFEFRDDAHAEEFAANPIAHSNLIKSLVAQYNAAERALIAKVEANSMLKFYTAGISHAGYSASTRNAIDALIQDEPLEEQLQALKSMFWTTVFSKSKLSSKATSSFRDEFDKFATGQSRMVFNESNILEVFAVFFGTQDQVMQDCIVAVFDVLSMYDEKNKVHIEGWKTNDAWRVNKKVIIPDCLDMNGYGGRFQFNRWGRRANTLSDLDKVLCYITGVSFDSIVGSQEALTAQIDAVNSGKAGYTESVDSHWVKMKFFKKGTLHLEFKDLAVLAEFNRRAAFGKQWLADESSAPKPPKRKALVAA